MTSRNGNVPDEKPGDGQDAVIEEFLEGQPRADTWKELREVLTVRYKEALATRDQMDPDDAAFASQEKRVRELREQIAALAQEEAVTRFVEDSVRASLARPSTESGADDDDEAGYY